MAWTRMLKCKILLMIACAMMTRKQIGCAMRLCALSRIVIAQKQKLLRK